MGLLDKVVKIEKRLEKLAARKDGPLTALEIRRAILDDIEEQVRPAGRSRKVFPYDRLAIEVLGADRKAEASAPRSVPPRAELEAVLDPAEGFLDAIRDRLREAGCEKVAPLQVTVKVVTKRKAAWGDDAFYQVTYERTPEAAVGATGRSPIPGETEKPPVGATGRSPIPTERSPVPTDRSPIPGTPARPAQLVVLEGEATKKSYAMTGPVTNVGRQAEVTDKHHRVVRRNQVVFADTDDETNQTVSRAQAHIRLVAPGEYRLFDDRSSYGTRILRDGRIIEIPSGSPRGVKLQPGDEIHFGRARVVFQIK